MSQTLPQDSVTFNLEGVNLSATPLLYEVEIDHKTIVGPLELFATVEDILKQSISRVAILRLPLTDFGVFPVLLVTLQDRRHYIVCLIPNEPSSTGSDYPDLEPHTNYAGISNISFYIINESLPHNIRKMLCI